MKKITRKKSMSNKSNKSMLFGLIAVIVLVASYFLYRSLVQTSTVAEIRETPISCTSNIATFSAQGTCGNNLVSLVEYSCTNIGGVKQIGGPSGCVDIKDAFAQAQKACGQTCTNPSPKTSPPPTNDPSAQSITCKLKTYRIPAGLDGWSESYLFNPSGASVSTYEKIGYAIELYNPNNYTVGGPLTLRSTNLNGSTEPITINEWGGLCKLDTNQKTVTCYADTISINAQSSTVTPSSALPSMSLVVRPQAGSGMAPYTGIKFTGSLGASSFECSPITQIKITTTPPASTVPMPSSTIMPSPSPSPSSTPSGCYEEQRFCISSLVGRKCPVTLVCPKPTATPTPTPTPTATPVVTSIPTTKPTTCGKSLSKWSYREQCSTNPNSYRYVDYSCAGDSAMRSLGGSSSCKTESGWYNEVKLACANLSCETPTPSVVATAKPVPTPTPAPNRCIRIFGRNLCWPTARR